MTMNIEPDARQTQVVAPERGPAVQGMESTSNWRPGGVRTVGSEQLFTGHAEVQIEHRGAIYRLRQTALGKLILTK